MSPRRRRDAPPDFYEHALSEAERQSLAAARAVEGLDEEIALLRVRLREALVDHPGDARLLQTGARLLIQALLAQHRLSPRQADHLGEAVAHVLDEFGEALGIHGDG